jgi:hypothetical protein
MEEITGIVETLTVEEQAKVRDFARTLQAKAGVKFEDRVSAYGKYANYRVSSESVDRRNQEEIAHEDGAKMATAEESGVSTPVIPVEKRVSALGKFAHLSVSSEEFMRRKREEIEREERRSERWRTHPK